MSFLGDFNKYNRFDEFSFYSTENGTNGKFNESINYVSLGKPRRFYLREIRMHWSSLFASIEYFKVYISSVLGSNFNYIILSQLMSDIQDFRVTWISDEIGCFSDDHIVFEMSCVSGNNLFGLEVKGWSIEG